MNNLLLLGIEDLLEGILIPIVVSLATSVVRVALWGWKGARHFAANICISCFAGVCAHWILACFSFSPTVNAVIISLAALASRETLSFIFGKRTMAAATGALRDRLVHEILYRGRPDGGRH